MQPRRSYLIALTSFAAALLVPTLATAQGGPQFGNWGPGMAPPDQEGIEESTPFAVPGSSSGAAPYLAPGLPVYAGCPYDLRGNWWNDGRQTSGGYRTYSASVYVRQFRTWIQAVQDDGTSYYGQCLNTRLNFDVYNGYQYVGRQYGTINASSWLTPIPLLAPYAAPAPIAPIGSRALRADFTWTSWYGSGSETWYPTSSGYPVVPVPWATTVPSPTSAALFPTPTPAPSTAVPTQPTTAVRIDALFPARGAAGSEVIVSGAGFASDDNLITFGASTGLRQPDGTPANLAFRGGSPDGRTLRFTVPWSSPSGLLCDHSGICITITATLLQPGRYDVTVINGTETSNAMSFEMTANSGSPN